MIKKTIYALLSVAFISSTAYSGNFDGFYGGVYSGYAKAQSDITEYTEAGVIDGYTGDISPKGTLYGALVGYDWNLGNNLILGLSVDYEGRNASNTSEFQKLYGVPQTDFSFVSEITSTYSFNTRLGYILNEKSLVYLTAGITKADIEFSVVQNGISKAYKYDASHNGYNVGLGTNYDLGNNFQFFAEYRYVDYGLENFDVEIDGLAVYQYDQDTSENLVRIGLIYKF